MLKILHTADIHLDAHFNNLGRKGRQRRSDLRQTFTKIIDKGLEEKADILLIAGDLFEDKRVSPDTINFICGELKRAGIPVFISPGNHDPYLPDSYYATHLWPENVHIFKENKFQKVTLENLNVNIYGIANTSHEDKNNYLKNLKTDNDGRINIAMIHGADLGTIPKGMETYFGFNFSDIVNCGANYTALGHYHSYKELQHNGKAIAAYSGAPEPLTFADTQTCGAIIANMDEQSSSISFIPLAKRNIVDVDLNATGAENSEDIFKIVIAAVQNYKNDIVSINLKGELTPQIKITAEDITSRLEDTAFYARLNNLTRPYYDIENISKEKTIRGEFTRRMKQKFKTAEEEHDYDKLLICEKALLYGLDAFSMDIIEERA